MSSAGLYFSFTCGRVACDEHPKPNNAAIKNTLRTKRISLTRKR